MTVQALLRGLWRRRGLLLLGVLLLYGAAGAVVWHWPRAFVASAVVAPAETTGLATSTLLSPGPLLQASLLDSRPNGNFAIYLAALRSPEAAAMLARETPILADLSARRGAGWTGRLRRELGLRMAADADDVLALLERRLAATASTTSVTWTVSLSHPDRPLALDMLRRLHAEAEALVRAQLAAVAARRVAALEARLAREPDLFLRQSLFDLLAQQQRAALVIGADEAVAARLVSAPMAELRPSVPNRFLLLALLGVAAPLLVLSLGAAALILRAPPPPSPWAAPLLPARVTEAAPPRVPAGDGAC